MAFCMTLTRLCPPPTCRTTPSSPPGDDPRRSSGRGPMVSARPTGWTAFWPICTTISGRPSERKRPFTRADLVEKGRHCALSRVEDWFPGSTPSVPGRGPGGALYHLLRPAEIIEGSAISGAFKEIYASEFYYDERACQVAQAGGELHCQDPVCLPDQQGRAGRVRRQDPQRLHARRQQSGCPSPT